MLWTTLWFNELKSKPQKRLVPDLDMFFIVGTTVVAVVWKLNTAVNGFALLFYIMKRFDKSTKDLTPDGSEGMADEG